MLRMLIALALTAAGGQQCTPPVDTAPPPQAPAPAALPPCSGDVVLIDHIDAPTNCDLIPPQVLSAVLDDDPAAWEACDHSGGAVMHDPAIDRFYCIDMDY